MIEQEDIDRLPDRKADMVVEIEEENGEVYQYTWIDREDGTETVFVSSNIPHNRPFIDSHKLDLDGLFDYVMSVQESTDLHLCWINNVARDIVLEGEPMIA
jgi:hypothetical protein